MKGIKLPPGPPKLPLIGNFHLLGNLRHRSLENLSKKYDSTMLLQLGSAPTVIVSSAKTAQQVLKIHDLYCCTRPASLRPNRFSYNGLDVLFSLYNDHWKEMRKVFIFELLSMKRVQSFAYTREAEVDKLITSLSQALPELVNLNEKMFALADGIIGTTAFGKIYGTDQFKDQVFHNVLGEAMNMLFDGYLQMVLDQHLDHARPKPEQQDFVDFLIRLMKDESNSFTVSENCVKAMLFDAFIGGIVTTSTTILWAMLELIKNPRVMNKTFRLHPPVPILPLREAMREFKVGEFDILPKTRILVNVWATGRDPNDTNIEFSLANILYWFDWEVPNDMKGEDISMEE
ncbi:hypothetical protein Godav_027790 [Gossypium davidsonii]|uniref:Cytochrome P450 n=1 Tax=Gossypium davidsonii TaxID=34287 RepID=A0A7J8RXA9_GOSDV|nr:hypothetical protein [Gossypium davidsonii]